ncbi:xaa-Pro aminopeptidase 1-like isoform X2 [Styela clava]
MHHIKTFSWILFLLGCSSRYADAKQADPTIRNCGDPQNIYLPPTATNTSERLAALRAEMEKNGYMAYIVPSEDEHLSEYVAPRDKKRVWITGFTGSSGLAAVTTTKAAVWTDGRYFLQAEQQLDCNWILMKIGEPGVISVEEWISQELQRSEVVAASPFVFSIESWLLYDSYFAKSGHMFNQSIPDLIDGIWEDRPPVSGTKIFQLPIEYAGKTWESKISDVRMRMGDYDADYLLLTKLEENCWLFNLRGDEISGTPIFTSYTLVGRSGGIALYLNTTRFGLSPDLSDYLNPEDCEIRGVCVETKELEFVRNDLLNLSSSSKVWMSSESTTYGMYSAIPLERQIQNESPVKVPKAVKNDVEVQGMKQAHIYDAVALCEYLYWLEQNVPSGIVDEISGAEKLKSLRLAQPKSKGLSFGSISAVGPNAAVIHYGTSPKTNRNLTVNEIYLVDSGGQYYEGTTDVTRTLHFGTPTAFEIEAYTRVLMGMINIETAIFPSTLDGNDIDILARQHLYDVGLDFRHSTGHGIGHYLSIHEYPPGIGRAQAEGYPLQPGMFTSNEPGYYEEGKFGIRLENIVTVEKANTKYNFGEYDYLKMTPVTLVPFQKKLIDIDLLSNKQLNYLNDYHARVLEEVGKEANAQRKEELYQWLADVTTPVIRNGSSKATPVFIVFIFSLYLSTIRQF